MMRLLSTLAVLVIAAIPARADISIQDITTPAGINAWLVEEHSLPFTALEIRFRGGTSLDRPDKRGAINLMVGLLEEGSADMDARAFAEAGESLAASFRFDSYSDAISVSAQFLTENRDEATALLHDALTEPSFAEGAIERVRDQVMSHLSSRITDPSAIASETWDAMAFGGHPYGTYDAGTKDSVGALSREDLVNAFHDAIALDRIYVAAVGDITADELSVLIDNLFDGLPQKGADFPDRIEFAKGGGTKVVPFETPQSVAVFGHAGIARDDPDFFAAFVLNEVLGGRGSNSRLMDEVREKRGLTYGIGTFLAPSDLSETIVGKFASQNASMGQALEIIRAQWAKIAEDAITEDELATAQTYLTGSYPLRFDGNANIANIMVSMQMEGLPIDYSATRNDKVMAVTLDDAKRVAQRLFDPDALQIVVVGEPDGVVSN
ncbi:M16 family metallopeptidase [Aliiroseovarius sp. 2305UL8-7]|uniref:M16 family metallopeptidase n=1 Tax=Aliiroseovarius conchicola TaxID=3121637 RepID=UPI0035292D0D